MEPIPFTLTTSTECVEFVYNPKHTSIFSALFGGGSSSSNRRESSSKVEGNVTVISPQSSSGAGSDKEDSGQALLAHDRAYAEELQRMFDNGELR